MTKMFSQTSMIRGADGRLYAVSPEGTTEVTETAATARAHVRSGDVAGINAADHEAARNMITPAL